MTPQDKETFEELLANCADEPIRFPGAIQPHGVLLTLSEPALEIIQVSANVESMLARAPQSLIGQPLESLIGAAEATQVREALLHPALSDGPPLRFSVNGTAFEGLLHRHQGVLILELEIHVENFQPRNVAGKQTHLGRMLQRLQAATTLQHHRARVGRGADAEPLLHVVRYVAARAKARRQSVVAQRRRPRPR